MNLDEPILRVFNAWQKHSSGHVMLLDHTGSHLLLNEMGSRVWELIDDKRSLRDIVAELSRESAVDAAIAGSLEQTVVDFVTELTRRNLVCPASAAEAW